MSLSDNEAMSRTRAAETQPPPVEAHGNQGEHPDIAEVASLLAERSRALMLFALTDGRWLPASMLATEAGVSTSTASEHLAKLVDGGLVTAERHGRFRYFRLAGPRVATAVESLAAIAPRTRVTGLRAYNRIKRLRSGRTCYDHLAGQLGTGLMRWLVDSDALERTDGDTGTERSADDRLSAQVRTAPYRLGSRSEEIFGAWGIDLAELRRKRRPLIRVCVDWTEQSHHLAGGLGAGVLRSFTERQWLEAGGRAREVRLTTEGERALAEIGSRRS